MLIVWDEPRRLANLVKHRMDFAEFENSFGFESLKAFSARAGRAGSARFLLIGMWKGRIVAAAIVPPLGSEAMSLVSRRPASKRERQAYERP